MQEVRRVHRSIRSRRCHEFEDSILCTPAVSLPGCPNAFLVLSREERSAGISIYILEHGDATFVLSRSRLSHSVTLSLFRDDALLATDPQSEREEFRDRMNRFEAI